MKAALEEKIIGKAMEEKIIGKALKNATVSAKITHNSLTLIISGPSDNPLHPLDNC